MSDRPNHTVMNGVPMVCHGDHERHEGCVWEPLEPQGLSREAIQQGWRDYDAAVAGDVKLGVYGPTFNPPVVNAPETFPVSGEWIRDSFHPTGCGCGQHEPIDLYDTPIDLRPAPKTDPLDAAIAHLYANGDMFGVTLLKGFQRERDAEEDAKDTERARQA